MLTFKALGRTRRLLQICIIHVSVVLLFCQITCPSPAVAEAAAAGKRLALLVANGNYPDVGVSIRSASGDVRLLDKSLRNFGFDVNLTENLSKSDMQKTLDSFESKVSQGSIVFLYFEGFGIQVSHQNYLLPVDASIWSEAEVKRDGFDLDVILSEIARRGGTVKLVVIDAARHDPYERRFRAVSAGLAGIVAPEGTLALFSATPGKVNADPTSAVSVFMGELVKAMQRTDMTAEDVFTRTRLNVSRISDGDQIPWTTSSLVDEFYFAGLSTSKSLSAEGQPQDGSQPAPYNTGGSAPGTVASAPAIKQEASQARGESQPQAQTTSKPSAQETPGTAPEKPSDVLRDCSDCPELTVVPSGSFDMGAVGSPFTLPVHRVVISRPLAISTNEITFRDWDKCVAGGGCSFRPDDFGWGGGDQPVINVSWTDAKTYAVWLSRQTGQSYRLPSEAEWEYAARGGTSTAFYWGPQLGSRMANCRDCQEEKIGRTRLVGSFPPNRFGLNDMSGNVAEWVEDCWNDNYRGAPKNGSAWITGNCSLHVLRGGSFDSSSAYIKPAARFRYDTDVRFYANGFRVIRNL